MYIPDTLVVSARRRPRLQRGVLRWLEGISDGGPCLAELTIGEIQAGKEITSEADTQRVQALGGWLYPIASTCHMLPLGAGTVGPRAQLMHRHSDRRTDDPKIAATATARDLRVVTRHVRDFRHFGAKAIDPFPAPATRRRRVMTAL